MSYKLLGSGLLATAVAIGTIAAPAQARVGGGGGGNSANQTGSTSQTTTASASSTFNILNSQVFGFSNIFLDSSGATDNSVGDDIVGGFEIFVGETDTNQVLFQIKNNNTTASFIRQIYFDDKQSSLTFNSFASGYTSENVEFEIIEKDANLAQSNNIDDWELSFAFQSTKPGSNKEGIDQGEFLGILFDGSFEDVIANFQSGDLRVGMHVQGIGASGGSDSFYTASSTISDPNPPKEVPEPGTVVGLLALGGVVFGKKAIKRNS